MSFRKIARAAGTIRRGSGAAWGNSAMEKTGRKKLAEDRFAADLVDRLSDYVKEEVVGRLVVIALP
jgi:hypothetical protein